MGDKLINVSNSGWVTDKTMHPYMIPFVSELKNWPVLLNLTPIEAEQRIFSVGGRNPGEWRMYVKRNYQ